MRKPESDSRTADTQCFSPLENIFKISYLSVDWGGLGG